MGDLLTDAEQRVAVLRTQVSTGPVQIQATDIELIDALREQCSDLRHLFEDTKRTNTVMKRQATLKDKEISQLEAAIASKGSEIEAVEQRMLSDVESIRQEMAAAYEKLETANQGLADALKQVEDLGEENKQLRTQLEAREGQLGTRREAETQLRESWFTIKQERDGLQQKLDEAERQLDGAQARINEVIDQRVKELAEAEQRYTELESKYVGESSAFEAIRERAARLSSVGHGVVAGEEANSSSKQWADAAFEVLEETAAL